MPSPVPRGDGAMRGSDSHTALALALAIARVRRASSSELGDCELRSRTTRGRRPGVLRGARDGPRVASTCGEVRGRGPRRVPCAGLRGPARGRASLAPSSLSRSRRLLSLEFARACFPRVQRARRPGTGAGVRVLPPLLRVPPIRGASAARAPRLRRIARHSRVGQR